MVMKRENIADKGIWTGKKHYILNVYDNEGVRYNEPQLKMMGIEAVRSSTPSSCRTNIKAALKVIMQQGEEPLREFVDNFEKEFKTLPFEDVAFPRGCRNLAKYHDAAQLYKKGTPIAVRGALVYNDLLKQKGLEKKITMIAEGEKVKFSYMKLPNPTRQNVIAVPASLDRRLGLHEYIDYDKQFDKGFKEPIRTICNAIGWELDKQYTLDQFFGQNSTINTLRGKNMNKNNIDLSSFDFGFSAVDEQELDAVTAVRKEVSATSDTAAMWEAQADEWKDKANGLYSAIVPLLENLSQNEDKEYIYWPNRSLKIDQFKLKLQQLLND